MGRLRVLTWNVHGNYLYYLSQSPHDFVLPLRRDGSPGFGGRGHSFSFGDNVRQCPVEELAEEEFDCIVFQSQRNYLVDQHEILTESQRRLPRIYIEHDPPRSSPTDTPHVVDDADVLLVHVTHFNQLMWDSNSTPTRVIEHGVMVPSNAAYTGELPRGLTAINDLGTRGRRLGADIFEMAQSRVPIDLVGMNTEGFGGLGEVPPMSLPKFMERYRFYFHPVRYTSLALALCEAMMIGLPAVAVAAAETATIVTDDVNGYASTSLERLVERARLLIDDPALARRLGDNAREMAMDRFGIDRFVADWDRTFHEVVGLSAPSTRPTPIAAVQP